MMPNNLSPINEVLLVQQESVSFLDIEKVNKDIVGEKAFGLASIPSVWTTPFFVISHTFYSQASSANSIDSVIDDWQKSILSAQEKLQLDCSSLVYIRSSAVSETMDVRGKFHSVPGSMTELRDHLKKCVLLNLNDQDLLGEKICFIVQKGVSCRYKGHLSNERRNAEDKRDWLGQFETTPDTHCFSVCVRNWREEVNLEQASKLPLKTDLQVNIQKTLKEVAAWGVKLKNRLHFEWVWDGIQLFIVQAEEEHVKGGYNPTDIKNLELPEEILKFHPLCLKEITQLHSQKFRKISNVFVYRNLNLSTTPLYVLDQKDVLKDIAEDNFPETLRSDLSVLTANSLVIRMDINSDDQSTRQMLPRTAEIRDLEEAVSWIQAQCVDFQEKGVKEEIAFIFHNFIPAQASAFAFAAPGERKVLIESLWGIPEGLYYNQHDKYIVDTGHSELQQVLDKPKGIKCVSKKSYKPYCVAPSPEGCWEIQTSAPPFDYKLSISDEEVLEYIAVNSRKIAEAEEKSLSIMWFVDAITPESNDVLLPWFHEEYHQQDIPRQKYHRKKTPFDSTIDIKTSRDIETYRLAVEQGDASIRQVLVQPTEETLLRDKGTLRKIAELTTRTDAVILLEGATLSHAYYQLLQAGANVHVVNPFETDEDKREFNKLVRDRIPEKILEGGENVQVSKLSGEKLLNALTQKLVEESIEVLDASDHESILEELSDVLEVMDGILEHIGSNSDEIHNIKSRKKDKVGGFTEGIILRETTNPSPSSSDDCYKSLSLELGSEDEQRLNYIPSSPDHSNLKKWTDKRTRPAAIEHLLSLSIPLLEDSWQSSSQNLSSNQIKHEQIRATIKGQRNGDKMHIELSLFTKKTPGQNQLELFPDKPEK